MSPTVYLEPFEQTGGVWQGSSPSALLASLVFEKFIREMNKNFPSGLILTPTTEANDPINVLAFCDDLVIISKTWDSQTKTCNSSFVGVIQCEHALIYHR